MAAEKNNKYAQQWTFENAMPRFIDALEHAETNDDCLCLQDAIYHSGIPYTTYYYLADNHKDLNAIKKNTQEAIIRRVNKGALNNKMNATAAIWRMKQNGEREEKTIDHTSSDKTMTPTIVVNNSTTKDKLNELTNKLTND